MKRFLRACPFTLLLAVLALSAPAVFAAEGPVEIEFSPDKVEFFPNTPWKQAELTVTGPECVYFTRVFRDGERIAFKPFDDSGQARPDGVYSWNLKLGPEAETRGLNESYGEGVLCRGRAELPPLEFLTSTGYVSILEARFVDPFIEEDRRLSGAATDGGSAGNGAGGVRMAVSGAQLAGPASGGAAVRSTSAAATVLTNADGVIRNSLCVGFDCPNNPSFSDTTILMMENNTRIKFDDTSSIAGFPNRDWEIEANSSSSGGLSYFGVNDCGGSSQGGCTTDLVFLIEANAPANSIRVDDGGRVGFGTASPVTELHVVDGDTPTLRLQQDGSSGFAPQTWDVAGNETNFFVRDVTGGSQLPFRIQPGADSNSLFIASDNDVGIGTSSPDAPLEVQRSSSGLMMQLEGAGDVFFRQRNSVSGQFVDVNLIGNEFRLNFGTGGAGPELILDNNGNLTITGTYAPDYVFEPDYPLLSLDDLASFVEENKHLPNVVTDAEIKETRRINVNEFQMRLLEKIEELTLYTLQQHGTISAQQETIGQLEARLSKLENPEPVEQ